MNIFADLDNKTLKETLEHHKYRKLKKDVSESYSSFLNINLGEFLFKLKNEGDYFYRKFLNKNGDKSFCKFKIAEQNQVRLKGLYIYCVKEKLMYIGSTTDSYKKRIDTGYGTIFPKNCYLNGQPTNCRLNSLLNAEENVKLLIYPMVHDNKIVILEGFLIEKYDPPWNIQKRHRRKLKESTILNSTFNDDKTSEKPKTKDFEEKLDRIFISEEILGHDFVDIVALELHKSTGGYSPSDHRMPACCNAMRNKMNKGDQILYDPPKKQSTTLKIRYLLPRPK